MAAPAELGTELGFVIRYRKCVERFMSGGATWTNGTGLTIDAIDQLISEADAIFDDDATAKQLSSTILGHLARTRAMLNGLLAEIDVLGLAVLRNRASEYDSVAVSSDAYGLMGDLSVWLRDNSKTVLWGTVSAGTATAPTSPVNVGTGTVITNALNVYNENNQNIQNMDIWFACTADSKTGGTQVSQETFLATSSFGGQVSGIQVCTYPGPDGAGDIGGGNRLQNPTTYAAGANSDTTIGFLNFTVTNTPNGWTIVTGAAGTTVNKETTQFYSATSCLEFLGDVGGTLMDISQDANDFYGSSSTDQKLDPLAHYIVAMYLKVHGSMAGGVIEACLEGTGYTAGATEKATKDFSATPPTTWTLYTGVARMPKSIPTDMHFHIRLTTALTNTRECWIDWPVCAKMHFIPAWGISFAILAGATAFVHDERVPDKFLVATTNDFAGLFEEWACRLSDPRDVLHKKFAEIQVALPGSASPSSEFAETKAQ